MSVTNSRSCDELPFKISRHECHERKVTILNELPIKIWRHTFHQLNVAHLMSRLSKYGDMGFTNSRGHAFRKVKVTHSISCPSKGGDIAIAQPQDLKENKCHELKENECHELKLRHCHCPTTRAQVQEMVLDETTIPLPTLQNVET